MMGLAKMAPDGWAYYAREIAAGVEDYFAGHGEENVEFGEVHISEF